MKMDPRPSLVIPANAGIHEPLDPRMREDDTSPVIPAHAGIHAPLDPRMREDDNPSPKKTTSQSPIKVIATTAPKY
jgi:hypothetical protein